MQQYHGSCHCGAIRFSFAAEPITAGRRCNCSFCSRRGTVMYPAADEHFRMEVAEGALGVYQFGAKQAKHHFCRTCGIHTFSVTPRRPGYHMVNLGCVEGVDTYALDITVFDGRSLP